MSYEQRIEDGLRRRPSDERTYSEPLAALTGDMGEAPIRMTRVTAARSHRGSMPVLAAIVVILALGTVALVSLPRGSAGKLGPSGQPSPSTFALTGRIACLGQGPGYDPTVKSPPDEDCQLMAVPPDGYGSASWTLDPSVPFSPDSMDLHILVQEIACAGGSSADGRIVQSVEQRDGQVIVTVTVRSLVGVHACPTNRSTPYVVHVDRPVGSRDLLDGGLWPARLIARAGAEVSMPGATETATPAATPTRDPNATFRRYVVKAGDMLSMIATINNVRLCELIAANPGITPDHIEVGQVINIPVRDRLPARRRCHPPAGK